MFVQGPLEFSVTNLCRFTIQTFDANPVFEVSRLSYEDTDLLQEKVNELLESGYLEYSSSNWSSPARPRLINEKLEICVSYNKLNEISGNYDCYSMPTIPSVLNKISESCIFSKVCLVNLLDRLKIAAYLLVLLQHPKFGFKTNH